MRSRILLLLLFSVMLALIPIVHPFDHSDTVQVSAESTNHAQIAHFSTAARLKPIFEEVSTTLPHDPNFGWGTTSKAVTTTTAPPPTTTTTTANAGSTAAFHGNSTGSINGYPCGGDLPPCYVLDHESGGDPTAYNPGGCNNHGCYGLWQFSGEWAGKLGLPSDIASATVDQQNNAARILWDGGRGCSNWGAC